MFVHRFCTPPTQLATLAKFFIALATILLTFPALAQYTTGTINGVVHDPSGATVGSAVITATSRETGLTRNATTTLDGAFSFANLPVGSYTVTANMPGFTIQKIDITLTAGHISRWEPMLKVGASDQTVNVAATSLSLETEGHQLADTVTSQEIENLPANGRTVFSTLTQSANVQGYTGSGNSRSDINFFGVTANALTIGGNAYGMESFLEDGVTNYNLLTKTANVQPSIEGTQEVTIVRNGANARFDEPNVVNVVTKSGTNQFHGRVYDYLRNDDLNAYVKNNTTKAQLRYNQFGANLGGPLLHNKLFFLFDYSGLRQSSLSILNANVPTVAEKQGDFSADNFTVYDPSTYNPATKTIQPFPGNKIPYISDFAKKFLAYFPDPTGNPNAGYNYYARGAARTNYDLYFGRVDYIIGSKDTLHGSYTTTNPADTSPSWALGNIFNGASTRDAKNAYAEWTHIFSPNVVNTGRFGYNYSDIEERISGNGRENYSQEFGLTALSPAPEQWAPPIVYLTAPHTSLGNATAPDGARQHLFQYADEVNWVRGRHTFVFGFQLDRVHFNADWTVYNNGLFRFSGIYTNNHAAKPAGGSDIADLLLGLPYNAEAGIGASTAALRQYNFMPYVQDDWRITDKLTLNLGMRYDFYEAPADANGHSHVYNVSDNTTHVGTFRQSYNNFAPRFGFAYATGSDMTVRGGYGIYYSLPLYNNYQFLMLNPPNYYLQNNTYTNAQVVPTYDAFDPHPTSSSQAPYTVALNNPTPYVQQWNVAVQRSIGAQTVIQISYLGNKSTHTQIRHNPNQASLPTDFNNPGTLQSRRPYPWVGDVLEASNLGAGNYNGLELEWRGHFRNGIAFNANYVYSKAMDILTTEELYPASGTDLSRDWGPADYNHKHVVKVSGVAPLPFGRGRHWANQNPILDETIGGWNLSAVLSMNGGFPFYISATDNSNTGGSHASRANQTCNPKLDHPTINRWFNTACFVQPGPYELGNERRNNLIAPRNTDTNLSLSKNFPTFREQFLQFRADIFHALNHPLPNTPAATVAANVPTNFGVISSFGGSRAVQLSLKYAF